MNPQPPGGSLALRALQRACNVRPDEARATLASFTLVLILMGSYYILRPVRDAMASDWTDAEVSWLWTCTFLCSFIAVSLYGAVVARVRFNRIVPSVYGFFAASFVLFYAGTQVLDERTLLDKSFYVWISLFSLFHISVFWGFMADTFNKPQSLRLFGFIGAGASIGGLTGPLVVAFLGSDLGTDNLMLVAAGLIVLALPLVRWVQRLKISDLHNAGVAANSGDLGYIGGNPLAGFAEFLRSPYLLGIGLFIFLYTALSSFVYFEIKNLLEDFDRESRAQIYNNVNLTVNSLTVLIALFATGRIAQRFGLAFTLALVPALIGGGMLLLSAAPLVAVALGIDVARRVGNYAISRPAREMLFTAVDRETRFKAKQVIDVVVYRGGDMLNAWAFTLLTTQLGLGLAAVAAVGAGIAALWAATGVLLGRRFQAQEPEAAPAG